MALSRDQILAADDLPREEVDVPEWGGSVLVRMLNVRERLAFEAKANAGEFGDRGVMLEVIVAACCDESGAPLFSAEDAAALAAKSPDAVMRVAEAAMKVNRIGAADVEELAKNSEASPSEGSPSASRHLSE